MEQDSLLIKHLEGKFDSLDAKFDNTLGKMKSLDTEFFDVSTKRMDILETYVRDESNFTAVHTMESFMWWYGTVILILLFLTGRMVYFNYKIMKKLNNK